MVRLGHGDPLPRRGDLRRRIPRAPVVRGDADRPLACLIYSGRSPRLRARAAASRRSPTTRSARPWRRRRPARTRARARAAAPQPRRARATRGREELAVAPRLDQPTLARLVKVGASISEPIVDHREQIRLFAAADDRARRRHHSRTRHSRSSYGYPSGPLGRQPVESLYSVPNSDFARGGIFFRERGALRRPTARREPAVNSNGGAAGARFRESRHGANHRRRRDGLVRCCGRWGALIDRSRGVISS